MSGSNLQLYLIDEQLHDKKALKQDTSSIYCKEEYGKTKQENKRIKSNLQIIMISILAIPPKRKGSLIIIFLLKLENFQR